MSAGGHQPHVGQRDAPDTNSLDTNSLGTNSLDRRSPGRILTASSVPKNPLPRKAALGPRLHPHR